MEAVRKPRSAINATKMLNQLREEKGLPRVDSKTRTPRTIGVAGRRELVRQELEKEAPELLSDVSVVVSEMVLKKITERVELRLRKIAEGKEPGPAVEEAPRKARTKKS